jgi:hypothetical protein
LGLAGLAIAACEPWIGGGAADEATVRDSAGVTIVENTIPEPGGIARWTVDSVPSVTIGADSGDRNYELGTIRGVLPLSNGMIVVLNGQGESAFEFRFYDSTGKHVVTHGRRGQGPGEYLWVVYLGLAGGDTLVAVDFPNSRLSWVSASKGYLRAMRVEEDRFKALVGADASGIRETLVPIGDSVFAVMAFRRIAGGASPFERAQSYDIVDLAAGTSVHLGRLDEPQGTPVRLSTGTTHVMSMDAAEPYFVVDPSRRRMCAAITSIRAISCIDADGRRREIRWRSDPIPFTAEDRRVIEEGSRASLSRSTRRTAADIELVLAAREWPEHYRPFEILRNDAEGNFWILESALDTSGKRHLRFRVLDPDGKHIAFASPFPIHSLSRETVYIDSGSVIRSFEDSIGVPKVGVFRIRKGG